MSREVFWYYTAENLSPRVTPAFLARQRRLLLPGQYAMEHQNQWTDAANSITTAADVAWAMGQGWTMTLAQEADYVYEEFWDLGLWHDATVGVLGHEEGGLLCIDQIVTLQGTREQPVQLAAVKAQIRDWHGRFRVRRRRIESWQGAAVVQDLEAIGVPAEIMAPTAKSNSEEWPCLIQALAAHRLILPEHARLREELLGLTYELTPTGVRVSDRSSGVHQDHAVAVRGVVAGLLRPAPARAVLW